MVLGPEPIFSVVEQMHPARPIILLSPAGRRFDQHLAKELCEGERAFTLLCGRYEGVDQRVIDELVDDEISVGDFVLAGGELAALVVIEAVARLLPGVLGNEASIIEESFSAGLLEYPQYTRPADFRGLTVPEVLLGGNHQAIARWRHARALALTLAKRPDLIEARGGLSPDEVELLSQHGYPHRTTAPDSAGNFTTAGCGDAFVEE
jgi:tRNA (guanine37-N1)-methyltransferase